MTRELRKPFWQRLGLPTTWLRSLRVRLQIWYAVLLIGVVGAFGGLLYARAAAETNRQIDAQLESAALVLDVVLRNFPPHELGAAPDFKEKKRPPPGKKSRDAFLSELDLPRDMAQRGMYFAAWQADGTLIKASGLVADAKPATDLAGAMPSAKPMILSANKFREAWLAGPMGAKIVAGRSVERDFDQLHSFGLSLLGFGLGTVLLGIGGGWLIANRMVRPIESMATAASKITGDNLNERIDARNVDTELAGLATVLNAMLSRLEDAFNRQQQFTANASHELRTPLAIIRAQIELALSKTRTPEEYRKTLQTCQNAAERMANLAQALLTLARVDAGKAFSWKNVNLHDIVADCVTQLRPLAQSKHVTITAELAPLTISGNGERLTQVALNLINNAIKFNKIGGEIDVRLFADETHAILTVRDTGPGIPARDRGKIFQRFFRVDKSRSRAAGGNGLGLAICKTLVEAHRGTIDFESEDGAGATFRVRLPMQRTNVNIRALL